MSAQNLNSTQTADAAALSVFPVDLRFTLPVPGRPVFLSVVAGRERRSPARLQDKRRRHPLHTAGNILFMLTSLTGIYAVALIAMLALNSVIDF